jgi:hypothetical protein
MPFTVAAGPIGNLAFTLEEKRRERRLRLCVACAYDLRASPERCPECGAVPSLYPSEGRPAGGEI